MKARFDTRSPLNGRYTPAQGDAPTSPRCHTRTDRPSSKQALISDAANAANEISAGLNLHLEDEIPLHEIEAYARYLISFSANTQESPELCLTDLLPAYARLQNDYADACQARKEQQILAKQLIKATEPLLSNEAVAEQDKQGLLSVTGLAIEKLMQLKMRASNIKQRLNFLKQITPQYVQNYAQLLGHSPELCQQVEQRAKAAL